MDVTAEDEDGTKISVYDLERNLDFTGPVTGMFYYPRVATESDTHILPRLREIDTFWWPLEEQFEGMQIKQDYLIAWTDDLVSFYSTNFIDEPQMLAGSISGTCIFGGLVKVSVFTYFAYAITEDQVTKNKSFHFYFMDDYRNWRVGTANVASLGTGIVDIDVQWIPNVDEEQEDDYTNFIISIADNDLEDPKLSYYYLKLDKIGERYDLNMSLIETIGWEFDQKISHAHTQLMKEKSGAYGVFSEVLLANSKAVFFAGFNIAIN